jgi:hypothetical protein
MQQQSTCNQAHRTQPGFDPHQQRTKAAASPPCGCASGPGFHGVLEIGFGKAPRWKKAEQQTGKDRDHERKQKNA